VTFFFSHPIYLPSLCPRARYKYNK